MSNLPMEALRWLPFVSLEAASLRKYLRQGVDFMAFCEARRLPVLPVSFESLMAYFADYFLRGNTTRTYSTMSTRLKWFYQHVLEAEWIAKADPAAYRQFLRGRRTLCKLDDSTVDKARPLYARTLRMMCGSLGRGEVEEFEVLACFTLAHAAIQRLGELVGGNARRSHLRCYSSPGGRFFAFFYGKANKPKTFKIGQTPFAMISEGGNPFAFGVLSVYLRRVFGGFSVCYGLEGGGVEDRRLAVRRPSRDAEAGDACLFPCLAGSAWNYSVGLRRDRAIMILRRLLARVGIPCPQEYSGHSARRGGYVDRLHVPLSFVQIQGHWAPGSATTDQDYSVHSVPLRLKYF